MKEDTLNLSSTSALLLIKVINLQSKDCLFPVKKKKKKLLGKLVHFWSPAYSKQDSFFQPYRIGYAF